MSKDDDDLHPNVLVAVRLRPLSQKERAKDPTICVTALDSKTIQVTEPHPPAADEIRKREKFKEQLFSFDRVFSEKDTQADVYCRTAKDLIPSLLDGYNVTVFAYGATGCGKTYTMLGTEADPGIMSRTLHDLFDAVGAGSLQACSLRMSYLEIYNESIYDLLSAEPNFECLELREDGSGSVFVAGLNEITVSTADKVLELLDKGNRLRSQQATGANEVSSRSHAIMQIQIEWDDVSNSKRKSRRTAKMGLIDLAGSERAAETNNRGIRMVEGASINRSLLALGNCINALSEGQKGKYINYRDSKLTRLLKDSLGGHCRTIMIVNISPSQVHYDETVNTLKYATRARSIKNKIQTKYNVVPLPPDFQPKFPAHLRQQQRPATTKTLACKVPNPLTHTKSTGKVPLLDSGACSAKLVSDLRQLFREEMEMHRRLVAILLSENKSDDQETQRSSLLNDILQCEHKIHDLVKVTQRSTSGEFPQYLVFLLALHYESIEAHYLKQQCQHLAESLSHVQTQNKILRSSVVPSLLQAIDSQRDLLAKKKVKPTNELLAIYPLVQQLQAMAPAAVENTDSTGKFLAGVGPKHLSDAGSIETMLGSMSMSDMTAASTRLEELQGTMASLPRLSASVAQLQNSWDNIEATLGRSSAPSLASRPRLDRRASGLSWESSRENVTLPPIMLPSHKPQRQGDPKVSPPLLPPTVVEGQTSVRRMDRKQPKPIEPQSTDTLKSH
ncbi:P-loop containing nucleoside triphosphate hydrolase protein [Polychytrium aggregatum]|uniref:P-loop containing nucleoside triphosphate hydrolase protein n=1 Tax=Polychytrium aggregatum TaxID=110093 RepID=UPI0022FE64FA|nr:P-loop containing nucleoside triphosphate hydrolase protein [Polychytrium aggregatum]KAI9204309.1 P-loop containing nucleoside triphosphate hydrolase protein [Polychytrium aggregatum]